MPNDVSSMVREFHEAFGLPVRTTPTIPSFHESEMRKDILLEEFMEYCEATARNDLVGIADAIGDMVYVLHGTALTYGIDLDAVIAEIHRSNMTKLGDDGAPIYREDGKVIKGPNYEPPRIEEVLWPKGIYES